MDPRSEASSATGTFGGKLTAIIVRRRQVNKVDLFILDPRVRSSEAGPARGTFHRKVTAVMLRRRKVNEVDLFFVVGVFV